MSFISEIKDEMYGSIHTHFEDWFDTANDTKEMIKNFARLGCKKIAITGHGSMFSYEDAKEALASLKETPDEDHPDRDPIPEDVDIVPGVEIYFKDEAKHMVLVAKDYEGYQCLCKVITESSHNSKSSKNTSEDSEYLTPIVTLDNLRRNIVKGKVIATSACVGGVFCHDLGLIDYRLREQISNEREKTKMFFDLPDGRRILCTAEERLDYAEKIIEEYKAGDSLPENKMPTKAERERLEKMARVARENGEDSKAAEILNLLDSRVSSATAYKAWKQSHRAEYNEAKKTADNARKELGRITAAQNEYDSYRSTYDERFKNAIEEYKQLEDIFGKENFYFELQNHGLEMEKEAYQSVVRLAYEVGNPHFITSNDVHIGDIKGSATWERSVKRREFERFNRFKNVVLPSERRGDEEEYGIKTDRELKAAIEDILSGASSFVDKNGIEHTPSEIADAAVGNIRTALKDCKVTFPKISIDGVNHYPKFCDDEKAKFREEVEKGARERFPDGLPEGYRERLDYEMGIIESMGYSGYHLIVKDYLEYGRLLGYLRTQKDIDEAPLDIEELKAYIDKKGVSKIGMSIGPGRGSAAGSLVCYCLKITDLDPIPLGLLFERFLNPSRQTMPDIDSDFKDDIRDHVYEYIKARYGEECVSKVCTKSYAHGKKALMVARGYLQRQLEKEEMEKADYRFLPRTDPKRKAVREKTDKIKKDILDISKKISKDIDAVMDANGLAANVTENGTKAVEILLKEKRYPEGSLEDRLLRDTLDIAGIPGTLSMHACACLISGDPLGEVIPLAWNDVNKKMTTQCLYPQAEELGLLKMDLLGLKNLTVITKVLQAVNNEKMLTSEGIREVLDDKEVYKKIYSNGYTQGVFQVESPGMTKMMKDFKPTCFEDIILLVAAYRPGPMAFIPEIIATKKYKEDPANNPKPTKSITIKNDKLDAILAPTYGVPIYQEQVMQIFQKIAGYDLAGADNVRRFMSKKKVKKLEAEKPRFIKGCEENGISKEEAEKFFNQLVDFSKYAFNKSHAACYALVSVITAYLKKHYPRNFYKESISNEMLGGKVSDVIEKYVPEFNSLGSDENGRYIQILPPEIGKSQADIVIEGRNLRLGYGNIKGEAYATYNPAGNIEDFVDRNPEISDATVRNFVKLGMLKAGWSMKGEDGGVKAEIARCDGCVTYLLNFLDAHFEDMKRRAKARQLLDEAKSGVAALSSDDISSLESEIESVTAKLNECKEIDYGPDAPVIMDDIVSKMNAFEYEKELLGYNFSLSEKESILKGKDGSSFDELTKNLPTKGKNTSYNFPGFIFSKNQYISKNGTPYYRLKIIDKNGTVNNVTSFHDPIIPMGRLEISCQVNEYGCSFVLQNEHEFEAPGKGESKEQPEDFDRG